MPYTMADFRREYVKEHLKFLTPEEVLEGMPAEEILKVLPPEKRLKGLPPEERLKGLSAEEIERYLRRLKANTSFGETSSAPE